ncbi:MAG TPA: transposase [Desulfuromonadales bacterium]|nr:transposase [Desulfuromonadales bacterium]
MARKPRIHFPGAVYHVILRGNAGQNVFLGDIDRFRLFLLLQEGTERFGYRVHAFCLMDNHIHLVLQVGEQPLSKGMHNLSFRYTRWMNYRQNRSGHLFQGRYKPVLVDADNYLLELTRYVHLNPVRAGMVSSPADYQWSSHNAYLGNDQFPWLCTEFVLSQFQKDDHSARKAYSVFILAGMEGHDFGERILKDGGGGILGDDDFAKQVLGSGARGPRKKSSVEKLQELVLAEFACSMEELGSRSQKRSFTRARSVIGWLAMQSETASLTEVGKWFGRDVATMSAAVRRLDEKKKQDMELQKGLKRLLAELSRWEA